MSETINLLGCGILKNEVESLIRKNGWALEPHWLHSALHNYFDRLYRELDEGLYDLEQQGRPTLVFYGACHPRIEQLLEQHHTLRTQGQNCIVMLLGYETFMQHLGEGAYFLLEDWAVTWEPMITQCFGGNLTVIREIFKGSHRKMIAIRTPCSGDFTAAAEAAARFVDLPLEWMESDLSHLEQVLAEAISERQEQQS